MEDNQETDNGRNRVDKQLHLIDYNHIPREKEYSRLNVDVTELHKSLGISIGSVLTSSRNILPPQGEYKK